ncbi:hypothetical protein D210916BOD24_32090 [Alteromonas sp. D210916BOD_24]|uniref:hypothetical protein n=1 Tax=Alteromonas sp. D210916BOD_24 TaxID=3157618 RepID=UPI00399CE36D
MSNGATDALASDSDKSKISHKGRQDRKKRAAIAEARKAEAADLSDNSKAEPAKKVSGFADKKNIMWVILSGAMALTFVVMLFLPDSGMGTGLVSTYSAMLWCGFFGGALWRYREANGWAGFAYGSVVGLLIQFASQFV